MRLEIARPASAAAPARQDAAGGRPLRSVAPGERAVLWHQGESDAIAGTSSDNYARMLGEIIVRSRKDAGYAVAWSAAPASFHPDPQATIANQQAVGRRWSRPLLAVSAPGGVG